MVSNINILQENLERLQDLNEVMKLMAELDRIPVSDACKSLVDFMHQTKDPLLYTSHAADNPYSAKVKKKKCLIF